MNKVLVTGANGQLGSELRDLETSFAGRFFFTDYAELDITNFEAVRVFIKDNGINSIINCAAYTAVDKAEEDTEKADAINHLAVANLAQLAKELEIQLIHVSTDYVFDGTNCQPYKEEDIPNPQNVYGETKLKGEQAVLDADLKNSFIIRTSWVYSSYGANFVKTMLRLGAERDALGIISDQVGSPTYAADLAKAILALISNEEAFESTVILHYSNEGACSWYDFAQAIFDLAETEVTLSAIPTSAYQTPAKRPFYSLMSKEKIKSNYGISVPYWKEGIIRCIDKINKNEF